MAKGKVVKKIWTPDVYEVNIGKGEYTIEPQPIERIIEFDEVVNSITSGLDDFSSKYYVSNGDGSDIGGPFETEEEAEQFVVESHPDAKTQIREESPSVREVLEMIVSAPYPALKALIPDLKEEDCRGASLPNLKYVFDLIIEVNGVAWFENFVKNSLAPILPELVNMVMGAVKASLQSSTSEETETTGETA